MVRLRSPVTLFAIVGLATSFPTTSPLAAQNDIAGPRRIRGAVDHDQTWSGQVLLTGDVTIDGAAVTVEAGTTIEFAQATPNVHPTLTVGSVLHSGGRLELQGASDRPITIRSQPGTNAGRIVVYVRARRGATSAPASEGGRPAIVDRSCTWRHVRFDDVGYVEAGRAAKMPQGFHEPALQFHLVEPDTTLTIRDCVFNRATSVRIDAKAPAAIVVADNQFTAAKARASVDISVDSSVRLASPAEIRGNRAEAAIRVHASAARITENILIGLDASLVVEESPAADLAITGNYIHNTTKDDDGRYCLNCEAPDALIEANVLRGGTTCVLSGSRRFSGNLLIAQPDLSSRAVRRAHTHQLVAALPAGTVFERNLLIGPAYSMLIPQAMPAPGAPPATNSPSLIRHNVFDGMAESSRAIHVNPTDRVASPLRLENNLFLRVPTMIYNESHGGRSIVYADYNAAAPPPRRAFDQTVVGDLKEGQEGWAAHDLRVANVAELRLNQAPDRIPDYDADIQSGKLTIAALIDQFRDAYRPQPGSPLVGAGRADSGGASASRPSIGCLEPRNR